MIRSHTEESAGSVTGVGAGMGVVTGMGTEGGMTGGAMIDATDQMYPYYNGVKKKEKKSYGQEKKKNGEGEEDGKID